MYWPCSMLCSLTAGLDAGWSYCLRSSGLKASQADWQPDGSAGACLVRLLEIVVGAVIGVVWQHDRGIEQVECLGAQFALTDFL